MERKEYDLFANRLSNPQASIDNLIASGLSVDNTSLQDKSIYENNEEVRKQFHNQYGEFDQASFDSFYNNTKIIYNYLAETKQEEAIKKQATFHRSNMYADPQQRREGPDFIELKVSNPFHITQGLIAPGISGKPTKSVDELAQANKVLLNPTTAGDNLEYAQWGDAPNDNFTGYFFDTLVLAQYDEAGTHKDPITGEIVAHEAGAPRLDNDGNFYYEKLDGRDIYKRRVLNKSNVITTDGSWANQFDFFDADDVQQKSAAGSIMRNLALVGTMFIPYVGPWIAGISIATQVAGLLGTLGKMVVGSDSPTFSAWEGWSKSMNRQTATTDYAKEHPWCLENMINLIGDVMGQLREQRFIFTKVPQLFKGAPIIDKTTQEARLAELVEKHRKILTAEQTALEKSGASTTTLLKFQQALGPRAATAAQAEMDSFIKGYNKLGEIISRGYMTGITVGDTYGEAKAAGASDKDATLLTIGYALGEYQLLRTGLGRWNIPETRLDLYRNQAIGKALLDLNKTAAEEVASTATKAGKKAYVKRALNAGRKAFNDVWTAYKSNGTRTRVATLYSAAAEGVEEMSEELLADFSKGCFDIYKWLQGEDTRLNTFGYDFTSGKWNGSEIRDRYLLSLVGGAIGGGLTNLATNYKMIDSYNGMSQKQAIEQLVYMARNGGLDQFMKDISKINLDTPNLATSFEIIDDQVVFDPGTKGNNRDLTFKKAIQKQVNIIQGILSANRAISDNEFLDAQTLGDLRLVALQNSTTAGAYIQEYNSLLSDIIQETVALQALATNDLDTNNDGQVQDSEAQHNELSDTTKEDIANKKKLIQEKKKKLDDLVSGKRAVDFIAAALWETDTFLSSSFIKPIFTLYAEQEYGKKYQDLTKGEKDKAWEKYKVWKTTEARDELQTMAKAFLEFEKQFSSLIKTDEQNYLQTSEELRQITQKIDALNRQLLYLDSSNIVDATQQRVTVPTTIMSNQASILGSELISILGTDEQKTALEDIKNRRKEAVKTLPETATQEEIDALHHPFNVEQQKLVYETLANNLHSYVQEILNRGFANSETKNQIIQLLEQTRKKIVGVLAKDRQQEIDNDLTNWDQVNEYAQIERLLLQDVREIEALSNTPLEQNLNNFAISMGKNPINITQLINKLNTSFNESSDNVSEFVINNLLTELNNAIQTLDLYKAAISAARTDNIGFGNLFGFNATLNEAAAKVEGAEKLNLAEIDKTVADLFIEDINVNLNKLKLLKKLHHINTGQKLSKQDRVATRKDILIYKKLKYIVQILDDLDDFDNESVKALMAILNTQSIHQELLTSGGVTVKDKEAFQKENLAIENAVYEFFQNEQNRQVLEDPTKLSKLINPSNFDLYTKAEEILNEDLESLDDNSFIWWLASRTALKAQDFYYQYKQIINQDPSHPLAPIATQELAIYNNYASIINGNVFTHFYKAIRLGIRQDWESKKIPERKEILKKLGNAERFAEDKYTKYCFNFLPIPKYKNVFLTEGIPGSGKSTGVFKTTIDLLRKFHKEILDSVIIAHGANPDSALSLQEGVGLSKDNSTAFGRDALMKFIRANWVDYVRDVKTNNYIVPDSDYRIDEEGEIRSSLDITESQNPPNLIIIDEISKFTSYDLDLISKFAETYGITVLVAGDFDQSGVKGQHSLITEDNTFKDDVWLPSLNRTDLVRSPKLGVSMRTDNTLKTNNIIKTQLFLHNPSEVLELDYAETEEGLFGDKIIHYHAETILDDEDNIIEVDNSEKNIHTDAIIAEIEKLVPTLKKNDKGEIVEKIGYIFNKKSELYNKLKDKPYIETFEGGAAQGLEGRYFVVDIEVDETSDRQEYLKDIYTGISRAQQGSIIIMPEGSNPKLFIKSKTTLKTEAPIKEPLSKKSIRDFAQKRKDILDKVITDGKVSDIIPRTKENIPPADNDRKAQERALQAAMNAEKQRLLQAISQAHTEEEINQLISTSTYAQLGSDPDILAARAQKSTEFDEAAKYQNFVTQLKADLLATSTLEDLDLLVQMAQEQYPNIMEDIEDLYNSRKQDIETDNKELEDKNNYVVATLIRINEAKTIEELDDLQTEIEAKYPGIISEYGLQKDFETAKQAIKNSVPPPPTHQPQSDSFEEDLGASDPQLDTLDEDGAKEDIDQKNEATFIPEVTVGQGTQNKPKPIKMLFHSFNTFELGVLEGEDGSIIQPGGPERVKHRIDSVNGLIKIDEYYGQDRQSLQNYVDILGELRSIIFNTRDKADIDKAIQDYFGFPDIYTTFALKSSLRKGKDFIVDSEGFSRSKPNPHEKSSNEELWFNGSTDSRSKEVHNKSLVLIIGTQKTGNILELPLLTLSSPFTILQIKNEDGRYEFPEIYDTFVTEANKQNPNWKADIDEGQDPKLNLVSISEQIILKHENSIKNRELIELFKLYLMTGNWIKYIRDQEWTPAKNLELTGAHVVNKKGYYQLQDGLRLDNFTNPKEEWISVADFAGTKGSKDKVRPSHNPQTRVTKIMFATDVIRDGNITLPINKGHNFVLVSYDTKLDSDGAIIDQYIEQCRNPKAPKKVVLMYVLPPTANVDKYCTQIDEFFSKKRKYISIGYFSTTFKLLKGIAEDEDGKALITRKLGKLAPKLLSALDNIPLKSSVSELKVVLNSTQDWSKEGLGKGPETLGYLFKGALHKLAQVYNLDGTPHYKDEQAISIMQEIADRVGINLYYHTPIPKNDHNSIKGFIIPNQDNYTIEGEPFLIHGKVDSYTFKGHIGGLISQVMGARFLPNNVDPNSPDANNRWVISPDNKTYYNGNSNIANAPLRTAQDDANHKREKAIKGIIDHVLDKTSIGLPLQMFEGKTIEQAQIDIANLINSTNGNNIAFVLNNRLFITGSDSKVQGNNKIIYRNGQPITDITNEVAISGEVQVQISIDGKVYDCIINTKANTIQVFEQTKEASSTLPTLSVTADNIVEYIAEAQTLLPLLFKGNKRMEPIFKIKSYEDFIQALLDAPVLPNPRQKNSTINEFILQKILDDKGDTITPLQKQIIDDLMALEQYKKEKKGPTCPIQLTKLLF